MKRVILFTMALLYLFGFSKEIHAQQKIDNAKSKNSTSAINKHAKSYSIFSSLSLQPNVTIGGEEFSDPERNFIPSNNINYAGDINGDGKADFYYTVIAADESTSDLTDQITKIVVIYGSDDGLDEANSDLIRDGFRYVTDITGDGVAEAIKYEDDVLYLVVDESTGELQSLVDIELFELSYSLEYGSFGDFNGDGFRDILVYDGGAITANAVSEFYIINGAGALENVSVDTLQYMNGQNFRYDKMTYGDVDDDGKTELIQVSSLSPDLQSSFGLINIYQMNASQELELISTDTLSMDIFEAYTTMRFGEIGLLDANNDSNMELIISADDQVRILELSDAQGEYYSIDNALPNVFMASDFAIINDFNGNGAKELMLTSSDSALFIESDASLQLTSTKLPVQEGDLIGFPENLTENRSSGGDVNGDGIDDIVVDFSNSESETRGYRVYYGNALGSLTDSSDTIINFSLEPKSARDVFNAGDLNRDGNPDFGIVYKSREVHIFLGGVPLDENITADIIIENDGTTFSPRTGDFNGDGYTDLVVTHNSSTSEAEDAQFDIYFGGDTPDGTSDYALTFSNAFPTVEGNGAISNVNSIGDINNDGYDDLMFISEQELETTKIIFGGETLSSTADLELPFFSSEFIPVGDFNEDGIDDFAINFLMENTVNIHLGFDEAQGETFDPEPYLTFTVTDINAEGNIYSTNFFGFSMSAGDYDGDGANDLAIASYTSQNISTGEGGPAVRLFKGGASADSIVDGSISFLTSEFGATNNFQVDQGLDTLYLTLPTLATVPDQNDDGIDELLVASNLSNMTNAVIYFGGELDTVGTTNGVFLEAPNPAKSLGPLSNYFYAANGYPAVGDFDGDGKNEIILPQYSEFNFVTDPVYVYESDQFATDIEEGQQVKGFSLNQNYPNPFNPTTKINYTLPSNGNVTLEVFDITGRLVSTILDQRQTAGSYTLNFDASHLASGIYIYRLKASGFVQVRKMTLIK